MVSEYYTSPELIRDYNQDLENILSTPLTPDTVESYAADALNQLVNLSGDILADYQARPTVRFMDDREAEDAAFPYFDLPNINTILDSVAGLAAEITQLDDVLARAEIRDYVITPPDTGEEPFGEGVGGEYEPARMRSLSKTILLILNRHFDVDVHDADELEIAQGIMPSSTVRRQSYFLIHAPALERAILACDEEDNATYVFNTQELNTLGINPAGLSKLTKSQLKSLIEESPGAGVRLVQSPYFVDRLVASITDITEQDEIKSGDVPLRGEAQLLRSAREPLPTVSAIAREWGVDKKTVAKVVAALGDTLGLIETRIFNKKEVNIFSPEQLTLLRGHLNEHGFFNPPAPEDHQAITAFSNDLSLDVSTVKRSMETLGDRLGDVGIYRFNGRPTQGLSPAQQSAIISDLRSSGALRDNAPDGVVGVTKLAEVIGTTPEIVKNAISRLEDKLGTVQTYRLGAKNRPGFSPVQQQIIREYLEEQGYFDGTPPDVKSAKALRGVLGVSGQTVAATIQELKEEGRLGEVRSYRLGQIFTEGFDESQQSIIRSRMEERGYFSPAPEGVVSVNNIVQEIGGVSANRIKRIIAQLVSEGLVEEPGKYMIGGSYTLGLDISQKNAVIAALGQERERVQVAPEGVVSLYGLASSLGMDKLAPKRAYDALVASGRLEEPQTYAFGSLKAPGLDTHAQILIAQEIYRSSVRSPVRAKAARFLTMHGVLES